MMTIPANSSLDRSLSLATSMQANKGVYALLVGSGISRSAGIPSGWDVVLDLIRRVAQANGADPEPDPAAWYARTFDKSPTYSVLLEQVATTPALRSGLLRPFFEPTTDEEREQGLKAPTPAHRAIARLVATGYIRVIVTSNFDRLIERALEDEGIIPTVIATTDAAESTPPLVHTQCCVVKINGDYIDTRIRNTAGELEEYDPAMNSLLDRIFDEFGLIVCGWSADSDNALRGALERCKNHRYPIYWTVRGHPNELTRDLIQKRKAEAITISNADTFFIDLSEKVFALESLQLPDPFSARIAVARLKRYLEGQRTPISLHDFVMREVERVYAELSPAMFPLHPDTSPTPEYLAARIKQYDALLDVLATLVAYGCYWGGQTDHDLWVRCIERISNPLKATGSATYNALTQLQYYPAILLLYAGGIGAVANGRYHAFRTILSEPKIGFGQNGKPAASQLVPHDGITEGTKALEGERNYTPISDHLFKVLREPLRDLAPEDERYARLFDRFEYLRYLVSFYNPALRAPVGRFFWQFRHYVDNVVTEIHGEFEDAQGDWAPLRAGLFDGSVEVFGAAEQKAVSLLQEQAPI